MAKDILTDLREGLQEMTKEEMQRVIEAVEAEKIPPLPMTPLKVMKKVYEIARHHQMTVDEFAILLEFQGTIGTAEGEKMLEDFRKYLEEK